MSILILLKSHNYNTHKKSLNWKKIFKIAQFIYIDPSFVKEMHSNFNKEKQRFKVKIKNNN